MKSPETYSDDEAAKRRDEIVKRMLNTPPQPRPKPMKRPKPLTSSDPASEAP